MSSRGASGRAAHPRSRRDGSGRWSSSASPSATRSRISASRSSTRVSRTSTRCMTSSPRSCASARRRAIAVSRSRSRCPSPSPLSRGRSAAVAANQLRAVLWDLDGTLTDTVRLVVETMNAVVALAGPNPGILGRSGALRPRHPRGDRRRPHRDRPLRPEMRAARVDRHPPGPPVSRVPLEPARVHRPRAPARRHHRARPGPAKDAVHPASERVRPRLDARAHPAPRRHGLAGRREELARQTRPAHTQHRRVHRPCVGRPHHPRALERQHHPDHAVRRYAHRPAVVFPALEPCGAPIRVARARLVLPGTNRADPVAVPARRLAAVCGTCLLIVFSEAFINVLGGALTLAIFVRVILSWIPNARLPLGLGEFVWNVSEPILAPIRRAMPFFGGIDFSPLVALLAIQLVTTVLLRVLPSAI